MALAVSTSIERQIIQLHLCHFHQDQIVAILKTGKLRVARYICEFRRTRIIPEALSIGRQCKSPNELIWFIEVWTLQNPLISGVDLAVEIVEQFEFHVSRKTVDVIGSGLRFMY